MRNGHPTMTMALSGPFPMRQPAFERGDNGYKKKIGVTAGKIRVKFGIRSSNLQRTAADNGYKKKIGVTAGKIRVKFGIRAIKQPATNAAVFGNHPTLRTPKILMGGACQNGMKPITNQLGSITSSQDAG